MDRNKSMVMSSNVSRSQKYNNTGRWTHILKLQNVDFRVRNTSNKKSLIKLIKNYDKILKIKLSLCPKRTLSKFTPDI